MASDTLKLIERTDDYESLDVWQVEHRREQKLDNAGFSGDSEVVLLGLEDMEDELTHEEAVRRLRLGIRDERHRYRGIPLSMCTPDERRRARDADIDDMARKEWDDES